MKQTWSKDKIQDSAFIEENRRSVNFGDETEEDNYQSVNLNTEKKNPENKQNRLNKRGSAFFNLFNPKQSYDGDGKKLLVEREDNPVNFTFSGEENGDESMETTRKGKKVPIAKFERDPEMDLAPIEEKDLGLPEDSFLLDRKVNRKEMALQMEVQDKFLLGGNIRKPREFVSIFDRGKSSPVHPKIDLSNDIDLNLILKKKLIAQQMLKNYSSSYERENKNATKIFKELKLLKDEEFNEMLKEDEDLYHNEVLITKIIKNLPGI